MACSHSAHPRNFLPLKVKTHLSCDKIWMVEFCRLKALEETSETKESPLNSRIEMVEQEISLEPGNRTRHDLSLLLVILGRLERFGVDLILKKLHWKTNLGEKRWAARWPWDSAWLLNSWRENRQREWGTLQSLKPKHRSLVLSVIFDWCTWMRYKNRNQNHFVDARQEYRVLIGPNQPVRWSFGKHPWIWYFQVWYSDGQYRVDVQKRR